MLSIGLLTLYPLYSLPQSPELSRWLLCAISHHMEHRGCKIHVYSPRYCKGKKSPNSLHTIAGKKNVVVGRRKNSPENQPYLQEHLCGVLILPCCCLHPTHWHFEDRSIGSLMPAAVIHLSAVTLTAGAQLWPMSWTALSMCEHWLFKLMGEKQQVSSSNFPAHSEAPLYFASRWGWGILKEDVQTLCQTKHASKSLPCLESVCLGLSECMKYSMDTDDLQGT